MDAVHSCPLAHRHCIFLGLPGVTSIGSHPSACAAISGWVSARDFPGFGLLLATITPYYCGVTKVYVSHLAPKFCAAISRRGVYSSVTVNKTMLFTPNKKYQTKTSKPHRSRCYTTIKSGSTNLLSDSKVDTP